MSDDPFMYRLINGQVRRGWMIRDVVHRDNDVIIQLGNEVMALSSTVDGGLRNGIRYVIHHQVPKDFNEDPLTEVMSVHKKHAINSSEAITFLTATQLPKNHLMHREATDQVEIWVSMTIGLTNPYRIRGGDVDYGPSGPSTINTAIIINKPLTTQAMIDTIALVAQVKAIALNELAGIHGTTSDAIAVIAPTSGEPEPYAGPATAIGKAIVRAIYRALITAYISHR